MSLRDRNIRRSVMAQVRTLFQSPPTGSGLSAYTVYSEDQLRQVQSGTLTPVRPCVFLVDAYIQPAEPALPLVVVEKIKTNKRPFELGNRNGRWSDFYLHCFGRMRGERDDLASFLADNFGGAVSIYDYSTGGAILQETGVVEPEIGIEPIGMTEQMRIEGSLGNWEIVSLSIMTKN